jgi:hypothetical protein
MRNLRKRAALIVAAGTLSGIGALLFTVLANANTQAVDLYCCSSGMEYGESSVDYSYLKSKTEELAPPCYETFLHVDYQNGSSTWQQYPGGWKMGYVSDSWQTPTAYQILGPVDVWGEHNACDTSNNCNGFVDTYVSLN